MEANNNKKNGMNVIENVENEVQVTEESRKAYGRPSINEEKGWKLDHVIPFDFYHDAYIMSRKGIDELVDNEAIPAVCLCQDAKDALGLNTKESVCIRLDSTPKEEFNAFYREVLKSIKEKAKDLSFTYIEFTDDFICGSDCAEKYDYLYFNEKALNILNAFKAIDKFEDRLKFTSCFEGHDTTYRVDSTNMDKLFALAAPKLKEIEERKKKNVIKNEKIRRVKEAIENGAISFHCESAPHDEDLSEAILTRPCPNSGSFTLTHRIPAEVFSKIKKFGVYYDHDFLEECDMFWSAPGWRFGKEAIETLLRENFKVFVDCEDVSLTQD